MNFLLAPHAFLLNKTYMWQVSASSIPLFQVDGITTVLRGPSQRRCRDPECQISLAPASRVWLALKEWCYKFGKTNHVYPCYDFLILR